MVKLLGRVRQALRLRHYSAKTEIVYVRWIRRFIRFHGNRHPTELGPEEVAGFLSSLAALTSAAVKSTAPHTIIWGEGANGSTKTATSWRRASPCSP